MSIEVRPSQSSDLPKIEQLANGVFFPDYPGTFAGMFPTLIGEESVGNSIVAADGEKIVTHVGLQPFTINIDGISVPTCCIGGVSTNPDYRGKGLAWQAMETAISQSIDAGMVLMIISGGRSLYKKQHATTFGPNHMYKISRESLGAAAGRPFADDDVEQVTALHQSRHCRYEADATLFSILQNAFFFNGCSAFVHQTPNGKIDAWVLLKHKGITFKLDENEAEVMDYAGNPESFASLLAFALDHLGRNLVQLKCLKSEKELCRKFQAISGDPQVSRFGGTTVKLLNLKKLLDLFSDRLKSLNPKIDGDYLIVQSSAGEIKFDNPKAINELLFVESSRWEEDPELAKKIGTVLEPHLPIPLPFYGIHYI